MRTDDLTKFYNTGLVLLAIFCVTYSSYHLLELDGDGKKINLISIGEVFDSNRDVRRKNKDELFWSSLERKNPIYGFDSVFTNEKAQAKVRLTNESEIIIDELSMVNFEKEDELEIEQGNLDLFIKANSKPLNIKIGQSKFKLSALKDSQVTIEKDSSYKKLRVEAGKVEVEVEKNDYSNGKGNTQNVSLAEGQSVLLSQDKVEVKINQFNLIHPVGTVVLPRGERLEFEFKSQEPVKKIWIKRDGAEFELEPAQSINLRGGSYSWGIQSRSGKISQANNFTLVKRISPPNIKVALGQPIINVEAFPANIKILNKSRNKVWMEVLDETGNFIFKGFLNEANSKKATRLTLNQIGQYSWRAKVLEPFEVSNFSDWEKFEITNNELFKTVNRIELIKPNSQVSFSWESEGEAEFIIAKDKALKKVIKKMRTSRSRISVNISEPGEYYWQVKSQSPIKMRKIIVVPIPAPTRAPKVKAIKKVIQSSSIWRKIWEILIPSAYAGEFETVIEWEKIKTAKNYQVQIFKDQNSEKPIFDSITNEPKVIWRTSETGRYFYRVRYQDYWNRFSPYSQKTIIEIVKQSEKNNVSIKKSPKKSSIEKFVGSKRNMTFLYSLGNWQQDEGEAEIDGLSSTGHALLATWQEVGRFNSQFHLNYSSQYGLVFDEQPFVFRQLEAIMAHSYRGLIFGGVLALNQTSGYEVNEDEAEQFSEYLNWGLGGYVAMPLNFGRNIETKPYFVYLLGDVEQFRIGLSIEYSWERRLRPYFLGQILNSRIEGENDNVISRGSQFQLGVKSDF